jgi:hypothetical protein
MPTNFKQYIKEMYLIPRKYLYVAPSISQTPTKTLLHSTYDSS